ncbi:helix-turn-helix domain-containing protein [Defluviimonas sp. WL0024]|uniref:Helix-turn-helix domain-containing protein n=2 Tax=Albidovulum TaxID=205889 RepID=A0ABT2WYE2_9RHOB|nr:helix-turn-helix transcriptional regulator [Defluviimonas sp. WL0024]MCU9846693.1 helix-turn-helix domain-containing protein [Defluviimonas sp. WL0024]
MTGDDLKRERLERGWSQRDLARRAGLHHRSVQYWEGQAEIDPLAHAVQAIARAFGWRISPHHYARVRYGVLDREPELAAIDRYFAGALRRRLRRMVNRRVICGAKTRKGTPCRAKSEPGRKRCRFHGGKSTGPRPSKGVARIAEAQRLRWARWRAERAAPE